MSAVRTKPKSISFLHEFLKDKHVAALQPSSPHLMKRLLKALPLAETKLLVELGPGDGVAARAILPRLGPEARYVAIERNPRFAAALRTGADPRFRVHEGRAQDVASVMRAEAGRIDAIIASIPFTYLKKPERVRLVAEAKRLLRPGGVFVIFHQYTPLMVPYLAKEFDEVHVEFEPLNLFPCFLMRVRK